MDDPDVIDILDQRYGEVVVEGKVMAGALSVDGLANAAREHRIRWRRWRKGRQGRFPPARLLMGGGLAYPCSNGMSHAVLPLR